MRGNPHPATQYADHSNPYTVTSAQSFGDFSSKHDAGQTRGYGQNSASRQAQ